MPQRRSSKSSFQYIRSRKGNIEISGKTSKVYHCPADFEPTDPEDPSSSVGITFVVNDSNAAEDQHDQKKSKIPQDAKHKKGLVRFLKILETEREGLVSFSVLHEVCMIMSFGMLIA